MTNSINSSLLSIDEIRDKFQSEWVLLANVVTDENEDIQKGEVLCHSKNEEEVDRKALELRPSSPAVIFTGDIPENIVFAL